MSFLVVSINIAIFLFGMANYAYYYTPGNPVRPNSAAVDLGLEIALFIGLLQWIYIVPIVILAQLNHRLKHHARDMVRGGRITVQLNLALWFCFTCCI